MMKRMAAKHSTYDSMTHEKISTFNNSSASEAQNGSHECRTEQLESINAQRLVKEA
jgi:hypothetical protein